MANSKSINPAAAEQAAFAINSIAGIADAIHRLAVLQVDDGESDFDEHKAVAIRELASQIGYLADLTQERIGGGLVFKGGAEDWMLPPAYHWAAKGKEQTSARAAE